jgi:cob(I)alamin adenosyltransferase
MKIYTKTGDKGYTSLVSGRRVLKSEIALEAYGTIDELNSFIGLLITNLKGDDVNLHLSKIQNILFNIGSLLAKDGAAFEGYPELKDDHIDQLEVMIDKLDAELPPLKNFILPGGSISISYAHICRTICRRAERRVVALAEGDEESFSLIIQFLNRLSDFFFILSRSLHLSEGIKEIIWDPSV